MRVTRDENAKHRVLVYSPPKNGKTSLVTALPYEKWGKAIYIAGDRNAEQLDGVMPDALPHIEVEKADPSKDFWEETFKMATTDWAAEGFGVVVWDTLTQTAEDLFRYIVAADKCNHVTIGRKGTKSYVANGDRTDYGLAQNAIDNITGFLFQQKCHLIVVCHADISVPKSGESGGLVGGPQTVGSAQIREYARIYSSVIHVVAGRGADNKPAFTAHCSAHEIWQAGVRSVDPMPDMKLSRYPVEFWQKLDSVFHM